MHDPSNEHNAVFCLIGNGFMAILVPRLLCRTKWQNNKETKEKRNSNGWIDWGVYHLWWFIDIVTHCKHCNKLNCCWRFEYVSAFSIIFLKEAPGDAIVLVLFIWIPSHTTDILCIRYSFSYISKNFLPIFIQILL